MSNRSEPAVGLTTIFSFKKDKTPEGLVEEALKGFTDAHKLLELAQAAIAIQKAEHEAEIEKRQALLETATSSHDRLGRIKDRFTELFA